MAKRPLRRKKVDSAIRRAQDWPLLECLIAESWNVPTGLVQILVARQNPRGGEVIAAVFLVDLACLGVKDAFTRSFATRGAYVSELRASAVASQNLEPSSPDLAAKILQTAVDYAASLGFRPHGDYDDARALLGDADPDRAPQHIPTGGPDGKPLFISGPYDNVARIMRILQRNVGKGNFDYLVEFDVPGEEDEEDEDDTDWPQLEEPDTD